MRRRGVKGWSIAPTVLNMPPRVGVLNGDGAIAVEYWLILPNEMSFVHDGC